MKTTNDHLPGSKVRDSLDRHRVGIVLGFAPAFGRLGSPSYVVAWNDGTRGSGWTDRDLVTR